MTRFTNAWSRLIRIGDHPPTSPASSCGGTVREQSLREYPSHASGYELHKQCGRGGCAVVNRARCRASGEMVAVKRLDLDRDFNMAALVQECALMRSFHHPNVLPLLASFVEGRELWMVMPLAGYGSLAHIMRAHFPQGLEEAVIATIMREVLKGLEYVHKHGGIHRDVKADNVLVHSGGGVTLTDFGVAAARRCEPFSWETGRTLAQTFVGTPCWMAPEVLEGAGSYDASADIWSFGITLVELAKGRPPLARLSPMQVVLRTIQDPAPSLEGDAGFSRHLQDVVRLCLQKDPALRPSAAELLEHRFFRSAKDTQYLAQHLLTGLPQEMVNDDDQQRPPVAGPREGNDSMWDFRALSCAEGNAAEAEADPCTGRTDSLASTAQTRLVKHSAIEGADDGSDSGAATTTLVLECCCVTEG